MATVRITTELKREVRANIEANFRPVTDAHDKTFNYGMSASDMYEHALTAFLNAEGVARDTFDSLPDTWKDDCEHLSLHSINGVEIPYSFRQQPLPATVYAPLRMQADRGVLVIHHDDLQPVADNIKTWVIERDRITAEHAAFVKGVNQIMEACTTLKQAVEMWPQMVEVLPEHIKQRHLEPEVRAKKAKAEVDADLTDALSATLVGTKLTKAIL